MKPNTDNQSNSHAPWNKGKLMGQKRPLKLKEIWAIRIRLQMAKNTRELALFNLAIDSKLRGCDLVKLRVGDIAQKPGVIKGHHHATENAPACSVRNNRADSGFT